MPAHIEPEVEIPLVMPDEKPQTPGPVRVSESAQPPEQQQRRDSETISEHEREKHEESLLPTPAGSQSPGAGSKKPRVSVWVIVPIWMSLSTSVILYNNYLFNNLKFPYPVFTVTWHLIFATVGTRILHRTTNLLDGIKDVNVTKDVFLRSILPIGFLYSGSLILGNKAYLYLSVPFIQMVKAFVPVMILLISFLFRLQSPNQRLMAIVLMISAGVSLASYGELAFDLTGFLIQASSVFFEASRLVMVEILLKGIKMDPLVSLYYYAPVCAALNLLALPFTEGLAPFRALLAPFTGLDVPTVHPAVLLSNAGIAFVLNVASVFLIGVGSGLVLTLAGVLKDIILIAGAVLLFGKSVTGMQVLGYSIALAGLMTFRSMKK